MPECTKLEGKIRLNQVLVAEARGGASEAAAPVGYLVAAQLLQAQFDRSAYG